ncbi:GNAT family N-acetyltransferase [Bacillus luteus]|uniref:GNAT family N-acetyltransferase n=2 Tax=Alkalicoccus luteus TaxID=1237094 RepID=A0A969PTZ6_9BACI|nr:GNAT family N-acetyltransferase [Alkalicoccus luteus]
MTFLETKSVVRVVEETGSREAYIDDLMMADESREAVEAYLHKGKLFRIEADGNVAGVLLLVSAAEESMEIVNMALRPAYRGKGLGREAVEQVAAYCSSIGISRLIVGTANSSIGNLAFYQRTGFRMYDILQAYFDHYPEPFYENGIRGRDMVMLERFL